MLQQMVLSGYKNNSVKYQFTEEKEFYTKLPIGERGFIVGISYMQGKPILGLKEITIGENKIENIEVSSMGMAEFKNYMDNIN